MDDELTPGEWIEREIADSQARQEVPAEMEHAPDGTWLARKLGCVGVGADEIEARMDLRSKVELAYKRPHHTDEMVREAMEDMNVRETNLRIMRKLLKRDMPE